ncbi:MAG: ABC transporter permease [Nitrospirae bacterium]|nr:ABC transporter permease [Nitrospirota bacterium]
MLLNIIKRSFANQKKAMLLMIASVAVGTAMAASLITISLEISGKVSKELRSFGANILIEPRLEGLADISGQKRYLRQEDIVKSKTIFWRHNILGISPFLDTESEISVSGVKETVRLVGAWYEKGLPLPGEAKEFPAGIKTVSPWWYIEGQWPDQADKVVAGTSLAARLGIKKGDSLMIDGKGFVVSGILETGGNEDNELYMDLGHLQEFKNLSGRVSRVYVSALTTPMDKFAYKDPKTMSRPEYEKWYCTGYVTSIAKQLEEVFYGSRTKPIWQVAETEGKVLERLRLLIYFLCGIALAASALGVSTTMIMSLLRRIDEIGLMKATGADSSKIITIFVSEGFVIGTIGGLLGYALAIAAAQYIGMKVFNSAVEHKALLLPVAIGSALVISIAGTILPIRRALRIKPAVVLKGAG